MSTHPGPAELRETVGALTEAGRVQSPDPVVIVLIDEVDEVMRGIPGTAAGDRIRAVLGGMAAKSRSMGMSATQLEDRAAILAALSTAASVPQVPSMNELLIRQYTWPAGCHVECTPDGGWVARFTPRGCRYSAATLADVHAMAVKAAPAAHCSR